MATQLFANNAVSTLGAALSSIGTSLILQSGTGVLFPSPTTGQYFLVTLTSATNPLVYEIVQVTSRTVDTLTIVRAQEGSIAQAWAVGDPARMLITAGTMAKFVQS